MINLTIFHSSEFVLDSFRSFCSKHDSVLSLKDWSDECDNNFLVVNDIHIVVMSTSFFLNKKNEEFIQKICDLNIKSIVFGQYNDEGSISYFLSKGINCYLNENEGFEKIYEAINIVYSYGLFCPYEIKNRNGNGKFSVRPSFTERELEIFNFLRKEMTNREVSEACGLHIKTIEFHRKNIIDKCGSKKLVGAFDYLISSGTIPIILNE